MRTHETRAAAGGQARRRLVDSGRAPSRSFPTVGTHRMWRPAGCYDVKLMPRLRRKATPNRGGATDGAVLRAIGNLVQWGFEKNLVPSAQSIESVGLLRLAGVMTTAHLHGTTVRDCAQGPCKKAAVCKAIGELLPACPNPLADPIRALAQAAFDGAKRMRQVSKEFEQRSAQAQRELDDELIKVARATEVEYERASQQLRERGLAPLPPRKTPGPWGHLDAPHAHELLSEAPAAAAAKIHEAAQSLLEMEEAISATLPHPADRGPRTGGRSLDTPMACATWHLHRGGFAPREVADLLSEPGDDAHRVKRVRDRLRRLEQHVRRTGRIPWTVFAGEPFSEQVRMR